MVRILASPDLTKRRGTRALVGHFALPIESIKSGGVQVGQVSVTNAGCSPLRQWLDQPRLSPNDAYVPTAMSFCAGSFCTAFTV